MPIHHLPDGESRFLKKPLESLQLIFVETDKVTTHDETNVTNNHKVLIVKNQKNEKNRCND